MTPPPPPPPSPVPGVPPPHEPQVPWPIQKGQKVRATTTDFGFGDLTGCGCNGAKLTNQLAEVGYVGVATPNWLGSPYSTTVGVLPRSSHTLSTLMNTKYYSNCASDCGHCWQLETLPEVNMGGVRPDKQYTVNVVVLDTCEDRNDYGNNYQWCLAAKGIPEGGIDTKGYAGHDPPFAEYLRPGDFTMTDQAASWNQAECFNAEGNWICTNMAGEPLHFDFAIQEFSDEAIKQLGVWPKHTNPKVLATPIECSEEVRGALARNCGANAKNGDLWVCKYFCRATDGEPFIPPHWGGCGCVQWDLNSSLWCPSLHTQYACRHVPN